MVADQASGSDAVLLEEDPGVACVFAGYDISILQDLKSAK
jgi:hypothetical protein